jgi:hypothetical protein
MPPRPRKPVRKRGELPKMGRIEKVQPKNTIFSPKTPTKGNFVPHAPNRRRRGHSALLRAMNGWRTRRRVGKK